MRSLGSTERNSRNLTKLLHLDRTFAKIAADQSGMLRGDPVLQFLLPDPVSLRESPLQLRQHTLLLKVGSEVMPNVSFTVLFTSVTEPWI